jgi:hypothetical protein
MMSFRKEKSPVRMLQHTRRKFFLQKIDGANKDYLTIAANHQVGRPVREEHVHGKGTWRMCTAHVHGEGTWRGPDHRLLAIYTPGPALMFRP